MAGEQSIQLINALAFARGTQEPTNRNVLWIDDSIVGALYKRVKIYDKDLGSWVLSSRTNLELLSDLRTVDGAGSGLDADTLQGYTPDDFLGDSAESLSVGQLLVGQSDTVGVAKTLAGIATIDASGNLIYTSGSISHTGLTNIGTNTHAQIDSHISSTANPHTVTASQVGNTVSQWNASSIEGNVTNLGTLGASDNGKVISWDNATSRFVMSNINDDSIYANDGTLAGNRAVNGSGTRSLSFGNDVASENLSYIKVNSIQGLEQFASTFPFANAGLEVTKNPGNFIANLKASATDSVKIQLTSDEHRVVSVLGTNNLQQTNSSSISTTIVSNGGLGTTARLDLLGSGKVDLGTSGTVGASLVLDSTNSFTDRNATPKGLEYALDYSANYSNRSLVDKEYVDNNSGGGGILGIADSSGVYTYYTTYTLAIAGASAGDTIEQFGDIIETGSVQVSIDKNITINMNGYSYTLNVANTTTAFKLTSAALTDVKILNGSINKINGTGGATFSSIGNTATKPIIDFSGTTLSSDQLASNTLDILSNYTIKGVKVVGSGNISISTGCVLTDFNYVGGGGVVLYSTSKAYNGYVSSTTGSSAFFITSSTAEASNIVSHNTTGFGIRNVGTITNCKGYSDGNLGIYTYVNGNMYNCYGYSSGSYGIQFQGNECINSVGKSVASYGIYVALNQNCKLNNVSAFSSVASAFYLQSNGTDSEIYNSYGESTLNATTGHAFFMQNGTVKLINCSGKVANIGSNCIRSNTSANAYIVNLVGEGMTTLISNIVQLQTNTADAFGNTLVG